MNSNVRSPFVFRVNTGSCNGCDVELATTAMIPEYNIEKVGCKYTNDPKKADILLVTGPITARSKPYLIEVLKELPNPFVIVALGACPVSCGIFRDSYAIEGPLDKYVRVDINVSGCPPRPQAMLEGIAKAVEIWKKRVKDLSKWQSINPYLFKNISAPKKFRGKLKVDAKACTACKTCEEVCPSGAIHITKDENVYIHTTWYNTCCFCGNCEYFCPTGAIKLTNDFHTVNSGEEKYSFTTVAVIKEVKCESCGRMFVPASEALLERAYPNVNDTIRELTKLCPKCRQKKAFERLYL